MRTVNNLVEQSKSPIFGVLAATLAVASLGTFARAQADLSALPDAPVAHTADSSALRPVTVKGTPLSILRDDLHVVTSPARIRKSDLKYLIPLVAATGASLATDSRAMNDVVSHDPSFNQANVNASNVLVGGFIAAPVALFGVGQFGHNERARETGILGAEAMIDGFIVIGASKLIFFRERPYVDNAQGKFFVGKSGADSSFASSHSVLAWSSAAVLADRYPSHWMQAGVYTLATGVSLTRVLGQQHFPTDVLVGAAAGWLIGHYVSRSHHRTLVAAR